MGFFYLCSRPTVFEALFPPASFRPDCYSQNQGFPDTASTGYHVFFQLYLSVMIKGQPVFRVLSGILKHMDIEDRLTPKLYHFLGTAIEIANAEKGNVQFFDEKANCLKIVAHIGFNDEFLSLFKVVTPGHVGCGMAMQQRKRVIIQDTSKEPSFDGIGSTLARFGFSSVISTPLFDGDENFFGMLSVHFRHPHQPSEPQLFQLDRYLQRAAPAIARLRASQPKRADGEALAPIF